MDPHPRRAVEGLEPVDEGVEEEEEGLRRFAEEDVDWGGEEAEAGEDDRTHEEKEEDELLLARARERMEHFLQASPELKARLRSEAWQRCCDLLKNLHLDPADVEVPASKKEEDLRAGFTPKEARIREKARERAARHQAGLVRMEGFTEGDLPKSWVEGTQRKLAPGFAREREKARWIRRQARRFAGQPWRSAEASVAGDELPRRSAEGRSESWRGDGGLGSEQEWEDGGLGSEAAPQADSARSAWGDGGWGWEAESRSEWGDGGWSSEAAPQADSARSGKEWEKWVWGDGRWEWEAASRSAEEWGDGGWASEAALQADSAEKWEWWGDGGWDSWSRSWEWQEWR